MPHNKNKNNKRKFVRDVNISKTPQRQIIVRGKPVSPIRAATAIKGDDLHSDKNYVLREKFEFDIDRPDLIDSLLSALDGIDNGLIEQAYKEDREVTYETSKGMRSQKASVILSMMIFHTTEHRAQIVAALDKHNVREINLDHYSIFGYLESLK